jgi:hypothetical protein
VGHLAVHQQAEHAGNISRLLEQQVATVQVGGQQHAEPGDVEERDGRGADRIHVQADARVQFVQGAAQVAAGQLDAFGHAGGARGVQDERRLVGSGLLAGILGGRGIPPGLVGAVGDQDDDIEAEAADVGEQDGGRAVDDDHARFGVGEDAQDLTRG